MDSKFLEYNRKRQILAPWIRRAFLGFFILCFLLFTALPVYAEIVPDTPECPRGEPIKDLCCFFLLIQNIINFLLKNIVPPLAILFIAIGGIMYIVGGMTESEQRSSAGKRILTAAIWGVIIAFVSWLIINTLLNILVNPEVFPWPWNEITC